VLKKAEGTSFYSQGTIILPYHKLFTLIITYNNDKVLD